MPYAVWALRGRPAGSHCTCRKLSDFPDLDTLDTAAFDNVTANSLYACSTAALSSVVDAPLIPA
jgi:hypothetical protein